MTMADVVRAAALTGYFETMDSFAVDPAPLLREVGLTADVLASPEHLIPARAAMRLLEKSAKATGCLTLGLRMVVGRTLSDLGATSLLLAHQPTLREALAALQRYRARMNSTLVLNIEERGQEIIVREDFLLVQPEPTRQSVELALGVLARLCGASLGNGWSPLSVCFTHDRPPAPELSIYAQVFRCHPEFDCEFNGIVIATADLDRVNPKADERLAFHARQLLESTGDAHVRTTSQDVEQLIRLLLPSGRATVEVCAGSMGMTVRTLQRVLDAEHESFSKLLSRTRSQLAVQYLANLRMRVTDVADLLGYNSIGAFSRWFASSFGQSPREWRKDAQARMSG
jgi:AraC-like DNA-binding protein